MESHAYIEPNDAYEIIEGVKYMAAASPFPYHGTIVSRLFRILDSYVFEKQLGVVFPDNIDVNLPDGNVVRPDVSIFCDFSIINQFKKIKGVPDLCVEVLSRSTMKNDRTRKKDIYECNGVKEYWIVDPINKSIEVYHLIDGKYVLDEIYILYSSAEWDDMKDEEKVAAKFEIKVSLFDDLLVDVREVFRWLNEPLPVYNR